jgi:hypothetical protein
MTRRYGSGSHLYTQTSGDDPTFDYLDSSNFNALNLNNGDILSRQMIRTDNYQMNFTAQYQRKFGKHDVSALFRRAPDKGDGAGEVVRRVTQAHIHLTAGDPHGR